jgi:hypothetical protein
MSNILDILYQQSRRAAENAQAKRLIPLPLPVALFFSSNSAQKSHVKPQDHLND